MARALLVVMLSCGIVASAAAQKEGEDNIASVEKLYAQGAALYKRGQYKEALDKFNEAYSIYPAPNLLFNIARCHQALGNLELAITTYKRFVVQPGIDESTKQLANQKIRDLQEATQVSRQGGTGGVSTTGGTGAGGMEGDMGAADQPPPPEPYDFSPWQWVTMGAGAAIAVGGAVSFALGAKDQSDADDLRTSGNATVDEVKSKEDSADTKKMVGYVLFGVGGAAIATGVTLLILEYVSKRKAEAGPGDDEPPPEDRPVEVTFAPLPGGGAAVLSGRF